MSLRRRPVIPKLLIGQIDGALAAVDDAQAELTCVLAASAPLLARRRAHASLRHAFDDADALLRQATTLARQRSYGDWSLWRHRLSSLDTARQIHLLAEQDEFGLLPIGTVRALDTGMSGPDFGDMQHGHSRAPGALPTYGMDYEALLIAIDEAGRRSAAQQGVGASEPQKAWEIGLDALDAPDAGHSRDASACEAA